MPIQNENGNSEVISAFAFNVGKGIEKLIEVETHNIKRYNEILEGKILTFRDLLKKQYPTFLSIYDKHFSIETHNKG